MSHFVFKFIGIVGMLFITTGIFYKKPITQDKMFVIGGLFLLLYSIYLRDVIFTVLQAIFIFASLYRIYDLNFKKNKL